MFNDELKLDYIVNRVKYLIALTLIDTGYKQVGYQIINRSWDELRGFDKYTALKLAVKDLKEQYPKLLKVLDIAYKDTKLALKYNYPSL